MDLSPPSQGRHAMRIPLLLIAAAATIAAKPPFIQIGNANQNFSANLSGRAEVPGPGDRNGSGYATVRTKPGQNRICYNLNLHRVKGIMMAHIHRGRVGEAGPPVLT